MRSRKIPIQVMLNESEHSMLEQLKARSGLSYSALFRRWIMSRPIKERPNADFLALTDAIDRIGVNFNQLVRKVNTVGTVSENDVREAKRTYQQVLRLMCEWEKTWR